MNIMLDVPPELEEPLEKAARTQGIDVAAFLLDNARLRPDVLTDADTELLLRLQTLFPPEQTQEYQALCRQSDAGTLASPERGRLLALLEQRDHQNADRLEIVAELAGRRGLSVRAMMAQLDIGPD